MKLFDVYSLYDIEPVCGKGNYIYTSDGTEYLDLYGGHAVISVGHSHPRYVQALKDQLDRLGFYSNSVHNSLQEKLCDELAPLTGYPDYQLFLCNSGAEANENAMKLASFVTGRSKVLAFGHSFHGRTSGAVAVTDNPKIQAPFNRTDKVDFVPLNDLDAVRKALAGREYCAVIVEGIQGVAGIVEPTDEFMTGLRECCRESGTLLIADEIQSGCGRSGEYFAHSRSGVMADIITMAKGIANGFPMGAVLISPDIAPVRGMLGTTFGGNHLACAAAIAVAEIIKDEKLIENAARVGEYLTRELRKMDQLKDVRGRGLMIGVDIEGDASELRRHLIFDHQVFTGGAGKHTVRLLPALTLSMEQADEFLKRFKVALAEQG